MAAIKYDSISMSHKTDLVPRILGTFSGTILWQWIFAQQCGMMYGEEGDIKK